MNVAEWPWQEERRARARGSKVETFLGLLVLTVRVVLSWVHAIGRLEGRPCSCPAEVTSFPQFSISVYGARFHVVDAAGETIEVFDDLRPALEFLEQLELATRGP